MNSQQVFTLGQEGLLQLLMVSAPVLLTVLVVIGTRGHDRLGDGVTRVKACAPASTGGGTVAVNANGSFT